MPRRPTVALTDVQRQELIAYRDRDTWPYVHEQCAAVSKVAEADGPCRRPPGPLEAA